MSEIYQRALRRGIRGFIAGAIATMIPLLSVSVSNSTWIDLAYWLNSLAIAAVIGGISGFLLALDKFFRDNK